jgi:predicted small secreted protein
VLKKLISLCLVVASAVLMSCGGSSNTITGPGGDGGGVEIASLQLVTSSPTLNSDASGNTKLTITAVVKDAGNAIVEEVPVSFSTSSGSITRVRPLRN